MHNIKLKFTKNKKLSMILQDQVTECGHACIAMISLYFGHQIGLPEIRKINSPSSHGVSFKQIINIFNKLNITTRALKVPINEIQYIKTPAILHWNMNHFVVLKKVAKNAITIHDPAFGVRTCGLEEFKNSFTGFVLEVEIPIDFQAIAIKKNISLFRIIKSVPGIDKLFTYLLLLSATIELLTITNPLFLQYIIDNVLGTNSANNLFAISMGFILLVFISSLALFTREHLILYTTANFTKYFADSTFQYLLSLPIEYFTNRHQGDIQSKFQAIEQIKAKISSDFVNTILDGITFSATLIVMFMYNKILAFVVISSLLLYILVRFISYSSFKNDSTSAIYLHAKATSSFLESTRAIAPIKLFLKEKIRFTSWCNKYVEALNSDIKVAKKQIFYKISNNFLFNLEHIFIICIGASLVLKNQLSIGMLLAFLAYRIILITKATAFIQNIFDYQLLSIQVSRLSDIILQAPEFSEFSNYIYSYITAILSIELKDICFRYHDDESLLFENLNITIQPGEKIAITGASGCGKSTLLKIMMGLIKPSSGKILINSIPLSSFSLKNYRGKIAAVLQDDSLFSGSILQNITFFDEEIDFELVCRVSKIAEIHHTIVSFPMGYETLIGDMGSILSGGQKQRILLARALYKKPDILFLDEATSHLDNQNEKLINSALKDLKITQIIVAHRKETIAMADRILNLDKSR
ncbi:MAG: hypothetical protein A3E88_05870 [Legionellales bacterium RIFCSPHIGHO2_12_FULL_35_11]|nr:MAG: hypothetical protein A3E88_05870 [Legionellales bacterium RIFCSPHIGHO2_12_FULL_35_11]